MVDGDIFEGEGEGEETVPSTGGDGASTHGAMSACLSCGATTVAIFCGNCGQKHDDMRRSLFILARDFVEDTFSFDSRMWRTLGVLAVVPGAVPTNYAHGKRSRYTPPVRLFLVVSFLFFLTLALTQTMFVAVELRQKTPEEIAEAAEARKKVAEELTERGLEVENDDDVVFDLGEDGVVEIDDHKLDCNLNVKLRFFVRAQKVAVDQEAWRACAASIREAAAAAEATSQNGELDAQKSAELKEQFNRIFAGVSGAIEDPVAFNTEINTWLPRVMFFMTPLAALIMGLFIRGRDALFFDHMVMSLYSHAVAFTLVGAAIIAAQAGVPYAGLAAGLGLFAYSLAALRQAYGRGWVKTVYSAIMVGAIYLAILSAIVMVIVTRIVLKG